MGITKRLVDGDEETPRRWPWKRDKTEREGTRRRQNQPSLVLGYLPCVGLYIRESAWAAGELILALLLKPCSLSLSLDAFVSSA